MVLPVNGDWYPLRNILAYSLGSGLSFTTFAAFFHLDF